jgi:iron(III) transport system substrate-binding protein
MGSQDVYDRVRTERENPQADIWWGAPSVTFARAEEEGLLMPYVPSWDSAVAPEFKSSRSCWYGTFITPEVIMYNTRLLQEKDAPKDWDELLEPRWAGKIIIRYPLASGTMRIIFSAMIERQRNLTGTTDAGFEWLRRLDANTKSYVADPTQLYLSVARGDGAITLWDLPDIVLQVNLNHYPFGYVIPASGTPLITDCIAIVKGTRRLDEAKRFYEFVTSQEAMIEEAEKFYRIPTRKDIPAARLPAWVRNLLLKPMELHWNALETEEKAWMKR